MTTAKDLLWETCDGMTHAYTASGAEVIEITERVPARAGWRVASNIRTWAVSDEDNNILAVGQADGLRAAKRAALEALDHLDTRNPGKATS